MPVKLSKWIIAKVEPFAADPASQANNVKALAETSSCLPMS